MQQGWRFSFFSLTPLSNKDDFELVLENDARSLGAGGPEQVRLDLIDD